jgi:hypothetical protein
MQLSYYPMKMVQITGSETATSHKGTFNVDMAYKDDPWAYAPADVIVSAVDANLYVPGVSVNAVYFETLTQVGTPKFSDIVTYRMVHGNDSDLKALGIVKGKIFKQGERIYKQGVKGTTSAHIHFSVGRGKFLAPGVIDSEKTGNFSILTTGGRVHCYDAMYVRTGTPIYKFNVPNSFPQDGYPWKYEPVTTYAPMAAVANMAVDIGSEIIRVRSMPGLKAVQIATLPINTRTKVLEYSTAQCDGYDWIKVQLGAIFGYSAVLPLYMKIVDTTLPILSVVIDKISQLDVTITWKSSIPATGFEYSLDNVHWAIPTSIDADTVIIKGLTQNTAYTLYFKAKSATGVYGYINAKVTTLPADENAELKKELAIANAKITAMQVTIDELNKANASLKAQLATFVVATQTLYEKV